MHVYADSYQKQYFDAIWRCDMIFAERFAECES